MTCANTGLKVRAHSARAKLRDTRSSLPSAGDSDEIAGTWDYKWPLGSIIRVAFQLPPNVQDFDAVRRKIESLVSTWGVVRGQPGNEKLKARISIEFQTYTLLKPMGDAVPLLANRSPFTLEDSKQKPYDVLVSLEPLPVARYDVLAPEGPQEQPVLFPIADLGSYARRADYGEPTVYIGPFGSFAKMPLEKFYDEPLAKHVVVHEFGHVLGLGHLHQHPSLDDKDRERALLPVAEIRQRIEDLVGITPDDTLLDAHLFKKWDGNLRFSDWPKRPPKLNKMESVMSFPYIRELLKKSPHCAHIGKCAALQTKPSRSDLRWLRYMYGLGSSP